VKRFNPDDLSLDKYITSINRHSVLTREEEVDVATRYRETKDARLRAQLINANLRIVVKLAHEYRGYGFRLLDLIQEGNIGLVVAADKFVPERGNRFITMAVWWIRAHIQKYVLRHWSVVRMGTTTESRRLFYKLKGAMTAAGKLGLSPDEEARLVAKQLDVTVADVREMGMRLMRDLSLDAPVANTPDSAAFVDYLESPAGNPEDVAVASAQAEEDQRRVAKAMLRLSSRERHVIVRRLMITDPQTLDAIGSEWSLSRERVRQIEVEAKRKLRRALVAA
jgi:RNA polymerase sigma-32 factor